MKSQLIKLLRSPRDGSPLRLEAEQQTGDEVLTGALVDASGTRYPIVAGVPLFAPDLAQDDTFAFKWRLIGGSYGHQDATRVPRQNWYLERFGFGTREKLLEFLRGKDLILDAGCGSGVDSALFAESGSTVIAIDLSQQAASSTYQHLGHLPNVHVLQADIQHLPFPADIFDYISCDQVLHHTPDTARSFTALSGHLRPEGHLALYVYSVKGPIREFADNYIRERAVGMPVEECFELCRSITELGKALSDLKVTVDIPVDIPMLGITAGPQDVQRFFYWNVVKCFWNDDYDFNTNVIINFDWYHPKYAWRHTPEEVTGWFATHGLSVERLDIIPSGISVVGRQDRPRGVPGAAS